MSLRKDLRRSFRISSLHERSPLPELVDRIWEGGGYGARRDRKPFRYQAFVPDLVGDWDRPLAPRAAQAVADATAALSGLRASQPGHDLETLATPLLRSEALGSSFIEGLRGVEQTARPRGLRTRGRRPDCPSGSRQCQGNGARCRFRCVDAAVPAFGSARHPSGASRGDIGGAIRRDHPRRSELDRRAGSQPSRRHVRAAARRPRARVTRRPHCSRQP